MKLNYKFWLEREDEKCFGDGPCDILLRVEKYGSLSRAAADINMSYSQAWKLINELEEKLGFKLLQKQAGGSGGGGSELTAKGKLITETFADFRREAKNQLGELEKKWFSKEFQQKIR